MRNTIYECSDSHGHHIFLRLGEDGLSCGGVCVGADQELEAVVVLLQQVCALEVVHHQEVWLDHVGGRGEEVLQDLDLPDGSPGRALLQLPPLPVPGDRHQLQQQRVDGDCRGCCYECKTCQRSYQSRQGVDHGGPRSVLQGVGVVVIVQVVIVVVFTLADPLQRKIEVIVVILVVNKPRTDVLSGSCVSPKRNYNL